ncbi:hypothetical protein SAMN04488025_104143 [Planifilum fulgidum]|uniref:Uncharacterized protein n=1 Tax=Planifilum fulgidum TaxID=201973 RepID=A0A1I2LD25_9BACL|nr:hypothetical protein [Planifilum fulgidum]MBO2496501.1 hypothetical protein [Bacillota bacterium]SFF75387.1 hypothetical protein SAMN04488025_104143 [Planifilum fulgidum]
MTRLARHLFASVFLSAMLAALLSVLPSLSDPAGSPSDKPVFSPLSPVWISKDTLVDFLAGQPVSLRILRASWEDGYLSLDLESDKDLDRERVCADLFTLTRNSLVVAKNVKQLRFRVYRPGDGSPWLTVEADRRDLSRDPGMENREGLSYREYLEGTFKVRYADPSSG